MNENLCFNRNFEFTERKREIVKNNGVIDQEFVRKFALIVNLLNNSQNYRDQNLDLYNQVQNEAERDLNQLTHPLYNCHSQYSEIVPVTQERPNSNHLESSNYIEFMNQNNSASTIDEINNQNYMSLETLKGKMSQEINYEDRMKSKREGSDLKWQDGKVSIKKGKVKVSCNYAFTPTRSSLRVRCIYCRKIYFSVKGFINHRGKCSHFKISQNNIIENSQINTNNPTNMFNFVNNIQIDKSEPNLQNRPIFNYGLNTQQTESSQQNTQLNCFKINKLNNNDNIFSLNNIFPNKTNMEEVNKVNTQTSKNNVYRDQNAEINVENSNKLINKTSNSFSGNSKKENGLDKTNSSSEGNDFENFKLHLYAAISCLPRELLVKIIKKKNPRLLGSLNEEQKIERDELIQVIFSGITSKKNLDTLSEAKISCEEERIVDNFDDSCVEGISDSVENKKFENSNTSTKDGIYDDIFLSNIPTFFRHSFPKNQEIKCYTCKNTNEEKMIMCENCGYTYHKSCQSNSVEHKKNDWFCDHCVEYGNNLILGSKFQIGELVWTNYKGVTWPGQIIGKTSQKFELVLFHIEKKLERNLSEIQTWTEGLSNIDGFASKGAFIRETQFAVMHWQSVYKGLKYYTNSLRSKPRRLPSINNNTRKQNLSKEKKRKVYCQNKSPLAETENLVDHPLPLEIKENENKEKRISDNIQENSNSNLKYENINLNNELIEGKMCEKLTENEFNQFPKTRIKRVICPDIFDC
ncbi:PHD finger containing protein [Cryptosporidium ryanae]|uniref:PHD finger containing protein n=1 Tax=Cryptosporidium ryanae TaxID=515981 RepID=UPI00351A2EB7|nr:PHD finger containing protein [Cryptosporidium ryanae]